MSRNPPDNRNQVGIENILLGHERDYIVQRDKARAGMIQLDNSAQEDKDIL
jgi:hypothetical protein